MEQKRRGRKKGVTGKPPIDHGTTNTRPPAPPHRRAPQPVAIVWRAEDVATNKESLAIIRELWAIIARWEVRDRRQLDEAALQQREQAVEIRIEQALARGRFKESQRATLSGAVQQLLVTGGNTTVLERLLHTRDALRL